MVSACAAVMFAGVNVATAVAQEPLDARTEFTFNAPVELPGTTLPPGTYVFRFADATTSRKVMQVVSKDNSNKTYGVFLTNSAQRPRPSDDAELRFLETPAGKPAAVKTWWYPGNSIGREFIYPKDQARRLAKATNTNVLTTKAENVPDAQMQSADLTYVGPNGEETAVNEAVVNSAANTAPVGTSGTSAANSAPMDQAAGASMSSNSNANTSGNANANANANTNTSNARTNTTATNNVSSSRRSLPRTSTMLPLLALIGLSSLAGGATLSLRRA